MNLATQEKAAESAYTTDERVRVSEHFTGLDPFRMSFLISASFLVAKSLQSVAKPVQPNDPLGFSSERLAQAEADITAGRVRSLDDVLNALRARLLRNGG